MPEEHGRFNEQDQDRYKKILGDYSDVGLLSYYRDAQTSLSSLIQDMEKLKINGSKEDQARKDGTAELKQKSYDKSFIILGIARAEIDRRNKEKQSRGEPLIEAPTMEERKI
jgi:hypothetical protein